MCNIYLLLYADILIISMLFMGIVPLEATPAPLRIRSDLSPTKTVKQSERLRRGYGGTP